MKRHLDVKLPEAGQMVRWLAEHDIEDPEGIRAFFDLDCRFEPELSDQDHYIFTKGEH